jgi:EAL domain-containing protein (putative c-di-GMP-specific phosphodiesterase class I)
MNVEIGVETKSYIVRICTEPRNGAWSGRLIHISNGREIPFASISQLMTEITRSLPVHSLNSALSMSLGVSSNDSAIAACSKPSTRITSQFTSSQIESALREAMIDHHLALYQQPIYDLQTNQIVRYEQLMCWLHPQCGVIMPDQFIPVAEATGIISELDRWAFREACEQLAADDSNLPVAINISACTLNDAYLVKDLRAILVETGVNARNISIEITESCAIADPRAAGTVLQQLRNLGLQIALDDFGRGHTSLAYLKHLPIDYIKVDRSLISGIGQNRVDEIVLETLVRLSQDLRLGIVAEGIEHPAQLEWVRKAGFQYAQGYLLGYPTLVGSRHFAEELVH